LSLLRWVANLAAHGAWHYVWLHFASITNWNPLLNMPVDIFPLLRGDEKMAGMSMSFMQTVMLAANENFASDQRTWAMEIRKLRDRKAKVDSVSIFFKQFPSDKQENFMDATMLVLKGNGTPGAGKWMQNFGDGVHVTINDIVDELGGEEKKYYDEKKREQEERICLQRKAFSKLPGKPELISILMSVMNGPARNLTVALNYILVRLVRTINAIADQKGGAIYPGFPPQI
jgi:hypothetical protein